MRKFNFKLQAFHDASQQRERSIRHDLVRAEGVEQRLRTQLDALLNGAAEWEERIRETQRGPLDHTKLRERIGALSMTRRQIVRQRQALEQSKTFEEEVFFLLIHGILHLCGYDHQSAEDALVMENLEQKILHTVIRDT